MTDSSDDEQPKRSAIERIACLFSLLAILPTLLACGARWSWFLELFTHFRPQSLLVLTIAGLCLVAMKRWKLALVVVIAWSWNLYLIGPYFLPNNTAIIEGESLRVLSVNLFGENRQFERCLTMIRQLDADLVVCLEASQPWAENLQNLSDLYPYRYFTERQDNFGIAVLSRIPWQDVKLAEIDSPVPSVQVTCRYSGRDFTFIGTHPPPPGRRNSPIRNRQLDDLAKLVAKIDMPTIVAGDLNTTPWSPNFQDIVATSRLVDTRKGYGIQTTWPSWLGPLGIPIDHVLVSREFRVESCAATTNFGSDHRGIVVDLSW